MVDWAGGYLDTDIVWPVASTTRIYDLAVPLEAGMTRHPHHPPYAFAMAKKHGEHNYPDGVSSAMEVFTTGGHVGTHVDALGHISVHGRMHGDLVADEHQSASGGLTAASTEEIPPLIGRGHLLDAVRLLGRELTPADGIGPAELMRWFADKTEPGRGSVFLLRTGWIRDFGDPDRYLGMTTGLPGVTLAGAKWLSDRGILACGSDTMNFEHKPDPGVVSLSVHVHNLVHKGIFIMESMNLEELAAAQAWEFLFFAAPLRIRGGTGSPLRPLALVTP